jgi:hypothetical protein
MPSEPNLPPCAREALFVQSAELPTSGQTARALQRVREADARRRDLPPGAVA